jgi:hypothetical protein
VPPLHYAARYGCTQVIEALIGAHADVNAKSPPDGATPLCAAAQFGSLRSIDTLLKAGAHVHDRMANGSSPLHLASINNDLLSMVSLVGAGAEVKELTSGGFLTFFYAFLRGTRDPSHEKFSSFIDSLIPITATAMAIVAQEEAFGTWSIDSAKLKEFLPVLTSFDTYYQSVPTLSTAERVRNIVRFIEKVWKRHSRWTGTSWTGKAAPVEVDGTRTGQTAPVKVDFSRYGVTAPVKVDSAEQPATAPLEKDSADRQRQQQDVQKEMAFQHVLMSVSAPCRREIEASYLLLSATLSFEEFVRAGPN